MVPWWHDAEFMQSCSNWMQVASLAGTILTVVTLLLWRKMGNDLMGYWVEREQKTAKKIKAVEKAAEQIRKDLLSTLQNQDIAYRKLQLAEMDADALRREIEGSRKRNANAEIQLKERIEELIDINITQEVKTKESVPITSPILDADQNDTLARLLSSGPKGELDIISIIGNPRSQKLASELKTTLDHHGWATKGIIQSAFTHPPKGLVLMIHSKDTAPSYAKFLQKTFDTLGMTVSAQVSNKYREWSISMIVGIV